MYGFMALFIHIVVIPFNQRNTLFSPTNSYYISLNRFIFGYVATFHTKNKHQIWEPVRVSVRVYVNMWLAVCLSLCRAENKNNKNFHAISEDCNGHIKALVNIYSAYWISSVIILSTAGLVSFLF